MNTRLHKSRSNRVIAGVCGGLGEYFDIDPTFVRLLFVLLVIFQGVGILAYIVLWIVMPREESVGLHPREAMRENINSMREDAVRFGNQFRSEPTRTSAPEEPTVASDVESAASQGVTAEAGNTTEITPSVETIHTGERYEPVRYDPSLVPSESHIANRQMLAGGILLLFGLMALLNNLHLFWWLSWGQMWPLILIAIGAYLLYDRSRGRRI